MPEGIEALKVTPFHDFDAALDGADVVMMLRLQQERMSGQFIPSPREYRHLYGLTLERLAKAKPDALVMHLNLAAFVGRSAGDPVETLIGIAEQVGRARPGQLHFMLVLRSDGSRELDDARREYRRRALAAGIAVFDEIADAGHALAVVSKLEHRLAARGRV
jgi:hypothetical protein